MRALPVARMTDERIKERRLGRYRRERKRVIVYQNPTLEERRLLGTAGALSKAATLLDS